MSTNYQTSFHDYYEGNSPYIFISYSHQDQAFVTLSIQHLQSLGFRIWYDSGVQKSSEWHEDVAENIYGCDAVLAFLSPSALQSENCMMELYYAKLWHKPILLAYLQPCLLTKGMEMRLGAYQYINRWLCESDLDFLLLIAQSNILRPCLGSTTPQQ